MSAHLAEEKINVLSFKGHILGKFTDEELVEIRLAIDTVLALRSSCTEWHSILLAVCRNSGFSQAALIGPRRLAHLAFARQLCMTLIYERTQISLAEVGALFGKRDHGTVLHAIKVVGDCRASNDQRNHSRLKLINSVESALRAEAQASVAALPDGNSPGHAKPPGMVDTERGAA